MGEKYWWVGVTAVSCDLTIDTWLVLFDKKCFHDLETEIVIVWIHDFYIVNQDFSCEFGTMSCIQMRFGSAWGAKYLFINNKYGIIFNEIYIYIYIAKCGLSCKTCRKIRENSGTQNCSGTKLGLIRNCGYFYYNSCHSRNSL